MRLSLWWDVIPHVNFPLIAWVWSRYVPILILYSQLLLIRDHCQITFITLRRLCLLSDPPPSPPTSLFLTNKTKLHGIPCKINGKIHFSYIIFYDILETHSTHFGKRFFPFLTDSPKLQALSGDFQHACGKMHMYVLLAMQLCTMCVFTFLKFYKDIFKKHRQDCEHSYSQLLFCH